jgi:hypothetical protein
MHVEKSFRIGFPLSSAPAALLWATEIVTLAYHHYRAHFQKIPTAAK